VEDERQGVADLGDPGPGPVVEIAGTWNAEPTLPALQPVTRTVSTFGKWANAQLTAAWAFCQPRCWTVTEP
jgi:hypothetical protein